MNDIKTIKILLVEDDPAHAESIRRAFLRSGIKTRIEVVGTLREFREREAGPALDVAIMDLNLPDGKAEDVLTAPPENSPFPILVITSYGDEQIAVAAMKAGALDYIVKSPEAFAAMPQTVERALREWKLLQERKQTEREVRDREASFQTILQSTADGILAVDREGRVLFANGRFAELWRIPRDVLAAQDDAVLLQFVLDQLTDPQSFLRKVTELYQSREESFEALSFKDGRVFERLSRPLIQGSEIRGRVWSFRDVTARKRAEIEREAALAAIQASLREKEILIREIHHRVKNNMQVISSLFNLQAGHTLSAECREILKEGQTRIRSMSLVHEKLYHSHDLSKIDLAGYIQNLAVHLFHVYLVNPDQVRLETDFEDVALDINSAVPCGLLLNELISNALKHGFPKGRPGVIKIGLRRGAGGTVELRVANDGVGFPEGMDFRRAETFGLQIVNLLVGQLEATIEMDRTNGTAFTVAFRELKYSQRI